MGKHFPILKIRINIITINKWTNEFNTVTGISKT